MMAWVTDSPHWLNKRSTSLTYRMLSSMQGSLGIGANISKWSDDDMATAKRLIASYHEVQPTIVQGDLYRLISPRNGSEFSATQTVNRDKSQSVVFAFIHSTQEGRTFPILKLKGLDPAATVCGDADRGETSAGIARGGQRRIVDESRHGHERRFPRRFSGVGVSIGQEIGLALARSKEIVLLCSLSYETIRNRRALTGKKVSG